MLTSRHEILLISFFQEGPVTVEDIEFDGVSYRITEHRIGWDFETGCALVRKYDGKVDGIALGGIQKRVTVGRTTINHPGYLKLVRCATETPIYVADRLRNFFAEWVIQRILKTDERFFRGRKVLFHNAGISPVLRQVVRGGAVFQSADALMLTGVHRLIKSTSELEKWLKVIRTGLFFGKTMGLRQPVYLASKKTEQTLVKWIQQSDIFFSFGNLIDKMSDLSVLSGKTLFVDYLSQEARVRLRNVTGVQVIEFIPPQLRNGKLTSQPLSVMAAMMDVQRKRRSESMTSDEYLLNWVQERKIEPAKTGPLAGMKRKCAFIVHPLKQNDLWKIPVVDKLGDAPKFIRDGIESIASTLPLFKIGTLDGIRSEATGQEVECDIYVMLATPKRMLAMDEEAVYDKLIQGAEIAHASGAAMIGLGAYTKVVGDAGVSVARGAPIPVTNGNSYSAATSIWAGEIMMDRLALNTKKRKAMVIGATGSIGRVSALVLSEKFEELVLVATSPDKLLEMKREILEYSPNVKIRITTSANQELEGAELILTATSKQRGKLFDIEKVMPGAVIVDCSRPFDVSKEDADKRPDVIVIQSGEVLLPGNLKINCDIGLPKPSVYACLAETVLLTLEGRIESYSLSKRLSLPHVKEILEIGHKHGARLSDISGPNGVITDAQIKRCRELALSKRPAEAAAPGLTVKTEKKVAAVVVENA